MTVTYYDEYSNKRLCEVVLLGSHDAGIDKGNANTKTQTEGIGAQARKGARFFDLRIAAFSNRSGNVSMRAYHDDTKIKSHVASHVKQNLGTLDRQGQLVVKKNQSMEIHNTMGGAKGGGLYTMLLEAKAFVSKGEGSTEFLLLKFDKSTNWPMIAEACIDVLGAYIYVPPEGKANLNECTLEDLRGKVVVLFTKDGCVASGLTALERQTSGILEWKNLYSAKKDSPGGYSREFVGLQYYGKGGTSKAGKGHSGKILMNSDAQTHLMRGAGSFTTEKTEGQASRSGAHAGVDPNVVGVMYWTTTGGPTGDIRKRNNKMWTQPHQRMLVACTELAVEMAPDHAVQGGGGNDVKRFMPNIVMVDFVTEHQGRLVKALNTKSGVEINRVING